MKAVIKANNKRYEVTVDSYPSKLGESLRVTRALSVYNGVALCTIVDDKEYNRTIAYIHFQDGIVIDFSSTYPELAIVSNCISTIKAMAEDEKVNPLKEVE